MGDFSLSIDLLKDILKVAKPFGHNEKTRELNIGFGFIYYGIVRALRPNHILVIGSGYGFSVVCLALGLRDNARFNGNRGLFLNLCKSFQRNRRKRGPPSPGASLSVEKEIDYLGSFGKCPLIMHRTYRSML